MELDGSARDLLHATSDELLGHRVLEHRRAAVEQREPRPAYSQVSLQGCHQSLMPSYRLPQSVGNFNTLDELGMAQSCETVLNSLPSARWIQAHGERHVQGFAPAGIDEEATYVTAPAHASNT